MFYKIGPFIGLVLHRILTTVFFFLAISENVFEIRAM